MMSELDLQSKRRLIGAAIWLLLLVVVVPSWYSNPVNFSPDGKHNETLVSTLPTIEHAYRLPERADKPLTNGQAEQQLNNQQKESVLASKPDKVNEVKPEPIDLAFTDKVSENNRYAGQWIVRLQAFNNTKQANELANKLKEDYSVYVKYFPKTRVYSVRTGPYISRVKADKDKQKLDKMLRTNGEVRQLPKNP